MLKEPTKIAAIHKRTSGEEGESSLDNQEAELRQFIQNLGYNKEVFKVYTEEGVSGGLEKRPVLDEILKDAEQKRFDTLFDWKIDRLYRETEYSLRFIKKLKSCGVGYKSKEEAFIDTSTDEGMCMFTQFSAWAELERKNIRKRVYVGLVKEMRRGRYLSGTPPYGYDIDKETGKLKRNEVELANVKEWFRWLADDKITSYELQKRINAMKIPTKFDNLGREKKSKSKCWWRRTTITRVLKKEIYFNGIYYYRKYKNSTRTKGSENLRPEKEWIKVEDPSLAIVSKEIFDKAQKQLRINKELSPRNTKRLYAFKHKLVCGLDGYRWQCATRRYSNKNGAIRETKYYFCPGTRPYFLPPNLCFAPTVTESRILPVVWENLKHLFSNPEKAMESLKEYSEQKDKKKKLNQRLKEIGNEISSFEREKERWAERWAKEHISETVRDKHVKECEEEIEKLFSEKGKISQFLLTEEEKGERIWSLKQWHQRLKDSLENATYEIKVELIQRMINRAIIKGEVLNIEYNFPFEVPLTKTYWSYLQTGGAVCRHSPRMD